MVDREDRAIARGRALAQSSWMAPPRLVWEDGLPEVNGEGRLCMAPLWREPGRRCDMLAGTGTEHPGVGRCRRHGGAAREGRAEAAWMVTHSIAAELDVSPWEALQTCVRRSAGIQEYWFQQLTTQLWDPAELEDPDSQPSRWLRAYTVAMDRTAKFAKMAVDAGVAERMAAVQEVQAAVVVRVFNEALGAAKLPPEAEAELRRALAGSLRALEVGQGV